MEETLSISPCSTIADRLLEQNLYRFYSFRSTAVVVVFAAAVAVVVHAAAVLAAVLAAAVAAPS